MDGDIALKVPELRAAAALLSLSPAFTRFLLIELRALPVEDRVTPPQLRALDIVANTPGLSLNDFAQAMGVRPPTASILAMRLGTQGLLTKTPGSGRRVGFRLTERGQTLFNKIAASLATRIAHAIADEGKTATSDVLAAVDVLSRVLDRAAATVARASIPPR
jgi:DNA-binding MarR family transcriptional regulator